MPGLKTASSSRSKQPAIPSTSSRAPPPQRKPPPAAVTHRPCPQVTYAVADGRTSKNAKSSVGSPEVVEKVAEPAVRPREVAGCKGLVSSRQATTTTKLKLLLSNDNNQLTTSSSPTANGSSSAISQAITLERVDETFQELELLRQLSAIDTLAQTELRHFRRRQRRDAACIAGDLIKLVPVSADATQRKQLNGHVDDTSALRQSTSSTLKRMKMLESESGGKNALSDNGRTNGTGTVDKLHVDDDVTGQQHIDGNDEFPPDNVKESYCCRSGNRRFRFWFDVSCFKPDTVRVAYNVSSGCIEASASLSDANSSRSETTAVETSDKERRQHVGTVSVSAGSGRVVDTRSIKAVRTADGRLVVEGLTVPADQLLLQQTGAAKLKKSASTSTTDKRQRRQRPKTPATVKVIPNLTNLSSVVVALGEHVMGGTEWSRRCQMVAEPMPGCRRPSNIVRGSKRGQSDPVASHPDSSRPSTEDGDSMTRLIADDHEDAATKRGHGSDVDEADTGNHGGGNANDDDDDDDEYDTDDYEESLTNSNAGPENGGKKPRLKLGVASFYKDEEGIRRMKLVIDVGKAFQATDFVVQFVKDDKVQVWAKNEFKTTERFQKAKFKRLYELSERIECRTLSARLDAESGRLIVEAVVKKPPPPIDWGRLFMKTFCRNCYRQPTPADPSTERAANPDDVDAADVCHDDAAAANVEWLNLSMSCEQDGGLQNVSKRTSLMDGGGGGVDVSAVRKCDKRDHREL